MSRSIGDGECKLVGVIPDPEIISVKLAPRDAEKGTDGDAFLIVASDGVWEFISSQARPLHVVTCERPSPRMRGFP